MIIIKILPKWTMADRGCMSYFNYYLNIQLFSN